MRRGVRRPASGVRVRLSALSAVLLGVLLASACARTGAPPGGPRDEAPPQVIAIRPEPMSTVAPSDEPVVIEFEERISERGVEDAIYVSPATGSVDVSQGRRDIEVRIAGGWQAGRVYRVVVQPTIRDLFDNELARPVEIAFSTGGEFSQAAVAGVTFERVTGTKLSNVRVEAHPVAGGAYHLALSDTGGVFRMPLLPPGSYLLRAYADQNRDRRRDDFEPGDSMALEVGATDTVLRALALMRPDTSAANLTRVQVADSVTLRLQFDDYMDVARPQERASVMVRALPDSTSVALAGIYYPQALTAERARQDSIARDSIAAAADTLGADSTAARPARPDTIDARRARPARADTAAVDTIPPDSLTLRVREANLLPATGAPLPTRELMIVLEAPLTHGAEYHVQVRGILNIAGVGDGGGAMTFRVPAAPPPAVTSPPVTSPPGVPPPANPGAEPDADAADPAADDEVPESP